MTRKRPQRARALGHTVTENCQRIALLSSLSLWSCRELGLFPLWAPSLHPHT